jgi:hypothetical protein
MDYISEGNVYAPVIGKVSISGLLFADDLAIGLLTINRLQTGTDQIVKYCIEWNLKKNEKWFMYDQLM